MGELSELKTELRSLVVSSPTQVSARSLDNDYRGMRGRGVPYHMYGYKDLVVFLREQCSDSFVFTGPPSNPCLTLIVPDTLKHIDQFVQKQKISSVHKFKGKRRSIPEAAVKPLPSSTNRAPTQPRPDLIFSTFKKEVPAVKAPHTNIDHQNKENIQTQHNGGDSVSKNAVKSFLKKRLPLYCSTHSVDEDPTPDRDGGSSKEDSSGKHPSSSSSSSTKRLQLEVIKSEIMQIISDAPEGVWCTNLIWLYRERYGRELNYTRLGYTSLISLVLGLEARVRVTRPVATGDWLLWDAAAPARTRPSPSPATPAPAPPRAAARRDTRTDPDDALPGVDFDPDVFPADCVDYMESIPAAALEEFRPGACIQVIVGEVYSPSHFWLIRYGEGYSHAMEDIMDEMTEYYTSGEGKDRWLACGAVRVGHYCSSVFENDWHRSIIVKIVDSDTVKVRHIDYGTVESVGRSALKPLRREWAALPAQATRARLAGARPSAAGRRWPRAAAHHFLQLVRDTRLFASVVCRDTEESTAEVLLIDTSGATDVSVTEQMILSGHADERRAPAAGETFLYPRFEALESGETPSFADINDYLRHGITLDYVDAYRRHVPVDLPPPEPKRAPEPEPEPEPAPAAQSPPATPSPPPCPPADTRVPLLWPQVEGKSAPALAASPPQVNRSPSLLAEFRPRPAAPAELSPKPHLPPPAPAECRPRPPHPPPPPPEFRCPATLPPARWYQPRSYGGFALPAPAYGVYPLQRPPPPPPPGLGYGAAPPGGAVTLSVAECEVYRVLCTVDPAAAQWYMSWALDRALARPPMPPMRLNAAAAEFRMAPASLRPPPGF